MTIKQKTELILGAFLLLTISCDCKQRPLGRGEDKWGATLTTSAAKIIGSINNNPVIKADGEIQDNYIREETTGGVVFIPGGADIKAAADELRENKESQTPDTYIALPKSHGFACYANDLKAEYTGKETIIAYSEKSTFQTGTTYMAHLVLGGKDVCFSPEGESIDFETLPGDRAPQVKMLSASAKKKITSTDEHIALDLESKVTVASTSHFQGGFLLIEQGNTAVSPTKLIAALIKQQKSFPTGSGFQQLDGCQGAIIYPHATSITGDHTMSEADVPDVANLFKEGTTYQVYCYVVDKANNYTISQEDQTITIPKPVVKLAMKEASIEELISTPDNIGINTLQLALKGDITQHEGTVNPTIGFLFATGNLDKSAAIVQIEQLLSKGGTPNSFEDNGTTIIYRANSVATGTVATQPFQADASSLLPRMLGKGYTVYFWLKDGSSEVFVSNNSTELRIPRANLSITNVNSLKDLNHALTITIDTQVNNETNLSGSERRGFLFLLAGQPITEAMLKRNLKSLNKGRLSSLSSQKYGVAYSLGENTFSDDDYTHFQENSLYDVYFWLRDGNVVFWVGTAHKMTTYKRINKGETPTEVKYNGTTYEIYKNRVQYEDSVTKNTEQLTKAKDLSLLEKILEEAFWVNGKPDKNAINKFLNQM